LSLDDTPKIPVDGLERGDKVCSVLPEYTYTVFPGEGWIMNHHKQSQSFFVEIVPANALENPPRKQGWIIHLMPMSRRDELAPSE